MTGTVSDENDEPLIGASVRIVGEKNGVTTDISVIIGSEGGFSEEEAHAAKSAGFSTVSLGKRILRTESAAPFVLACLSYELEE